MITAATAEELLDVVRAVVRASRTVKLAPPDGDLPAWTVAVLALLAREGEQRLGRVAAHLEVDPSVASRQVATLEQLGLLARRPDPEDRRAQLFAVTEAGLAAFADHRALHARWVAEVLEDWDDAEVSHLVSRLDRLMGQLHRALVERARPVLPARPAS